MTLEGLLDQLKKEAVMLEVVSGKIRFAASGLVPVDLIDELRRHKVELLRHLSAGDPRAVEYRAPANPFELTAWRDLLPALEGRTLNINGYVSLDTAAYAREALEAIDRTGDGGHFYRSRLLAIKAALAREAQQAPQEKRAA